MESFSSLGRSHVLPRRRHVLNRQSGVTPSAARAWAPPTGRAAKDFKATVFSLTGVFIFGRGSTEIGWLANFPVGMTYEHRASLRSGRNTRTFAVYQDSATGVRLRYYIDRESSNGKNTHSCINTGMPADGV
ncbi:hypothetical protein Bbelb_167860 [Branchiostoma belcheri]|nr:hypothetical protein Bbelb_167860 [Branchiostoma belcheri]